MQLCIPDHSIGIGGCRLFSPVVEAVEVGVVAGRVPPGTLEPASTATMVVVVVRVVGAECMGYAVRHRITCTTTQSISGKRPMQPFMHINSISRT